MPRKAYLDEISKISRANPTIVQRALLEVNSKTIEDVQPLDRSRLVNICKNRMPVKRRQHIVEAAAPLESYGYDFAREPEEFKIEKEVPDIERKDI